MITLKITNTQTYIEGELSSDWNTNKELKAQLRIILGYMVPGADFSPQFKEHKWDGIISLFQWKTNSFPTGCLSLVIPFLKKEQIEYKIVDSRIKPEKNCNLTANLKKYDRELFFYQEAAVERAYAAGRGILSIPTGGGKTLISCELISRISTAPFLFYVPSISLLRQTHREFIKYLEQDGHPPHIGFIGAGVCDINSKGINVITYQTALSAFNEVFKEKTNKIEHSELAGEKSKKTLEQLKKEHATAHRAYNAALKASENKNAHLKSIDIKKYESAITRETKACKTTISKTDTALETRLRSLKNKENIRNLIINAKGFMIDEVHIAAVITEALGNHAVNAYWHIGCSGTAYRSDNQEIRIQGTTGKKLIEISASDLIDLGFLVRPKIFMVKVNYYEKTKEYHEAYQKHITNCWERNYRIKQFAEAMKAIGKPVLIFVERIEHGQILEQIIENSVFVAGSDSGDEDLSAAERDYRRRMLNETESNNIILIATQWAYQGIDAPAISTLILAGSSKSAISTYQCIGRVLRRAENKDEAIVIDFMDKENDLHQHSLNRKRIYQGERSWDLKII